MFSIKKSSASRNVWRVFLAIAVLLCISSLAWGDNPNFPPPGRDSMPSTADVLVQIGPQTLNLIMLGERTGTIVQRGPRIDPPGPPLPYIETELVALSLHSASPMGPVILMVNPMAPPSLGRATANQPSPDLPATSFFDVFVEIDLPNLGMRLVSGFPQQPGNPASIQPLPVRVVLESLKCVPPGPGERFCTPTPFSPVPLTDLQTGQIVGQIIRVWHTIIEPNHFKVWRVQPVLLPPLTAVANDQFGSHPLQLNQIHYLSNPVQKMVAGKIFNFFRPDDHLNWYLVSTPPQPPLSVQYKNQFESTGVVIDNIVYFLVPTKKFPHPTPIRMDHYTGYRIQNPKMIRTPVRLQDQFDVPNFEFIDSLLPLFFLAPAQKNAEPVFDTVTHYVAYRIFPQDPDPRTVDTEDQFGIHAMNVQISEFLMVPTKKLGFGPPPQDEACCFTGPAGSLMCALVPAGTCQSVYGGTVVPACLGDGNGNGVDDACDGPPTTGPNHFKTWRVHEQNPTGSRQVIVTDQLMQDNLVLDTIQYLSNPTRKTVFTVNGPVTYPVLDSNDHLSWYGAIGRDTLLGIEFQNQFGRDTVNIDHVKYLLVPTRKFPHQPPDRLDHYKAYRIRSAETLRQPIELEDQFDRMGPPPILPERIDSLKERYFLTPAQKQRPGLPPEPVYDTVTHYVAYQIYPTRRVPHIRDVEDQFSPPVHILQIDSAEFLLVPTRKLKVIFPPPPEEACCYIDPTGVQVCDSVPVGQCVQVYGGTTVPACLGDISPPNGIDDACEPRDTACCDSVIVPNCLVMCPESDIPYTITLKNCQGNPVGGHPVAQMWLDFSQCPNICPCPEQALPPWPRVFPNGPSNALGQATWYIDAGLRCPSPVPCVVTLCIVFNTPTGPDTCCYVITNVRSTDTNCNLVVEQTDFQFGDATCSDFNCDGTIDQRDKDFWAPHLGHHCVPCDQFREEIRIRDCDEARLIAGDTCRVCLFIFNNTPNLCCIDSLVLQQAGFNATTSGWTTLGVIKPPVPGNCIPPGDSAEFCFQYIVPPSGHGCVRILKFSDCCDDTVQRNLDVQHDPFNCGQRCNTYRVPINVPPGAIYCVTAVENLPAGWTATYTPPLGCFPAPGPGVITVVICTNNNPQKGQQGCVTLVVTDPAGTVVGKATVCKRIPCRLGDADDNDFLEATDVVQALNLAFLGVPAVSPDECLDLDGDGTVDATDIVQLLNAVFLGILPAGCQ